MKKLMIALCACAMGLSATAGNCFWSWWVGDDKSEIHGCQLGIASECKTMYGAQISVLWQRVDAVRGGCQVAIGYNNARVVQNGPQCSLVNIARDGAALQFGLLNFNKKGFLPFFPFFNFASTKFGGGEK